MNNLPQTLNELADDLSRRVAGAKKKRERLVMVEWWELDSILNGEFIKPDDPDATDEDKIFDDTGELSNEQLVALVHRDLGEMPTQEMKAGE